MNQSEILKQLLQIYRGYLPEETAAKVLNGQTRMEEMAIRSVDFIRIIIDIENQFGFEFEDEDLQPERYETIDDMAQYVAQRTSGQTQR